MKYIIVSIANIKLPILFPDIITHSQVVPREGKFKIESAGFCSISHGGIEGNKVVIYGESESLQMKSRPEDVEVIQQWITLGDAILPFLPLS